MHSAKLLAFFAATAAAVPATVASGGQLALPKSPIPGYGVEVLEWEARATPGGPVVRVKGTVEDVVAELAKTNPDIRENILAAAANKQVMDTKYEQESYQCFGRWKPAPRDVIKQGIDYLRGVNGQPSLGPGLGNCTRVSCSYNAAIWWCNDNASWKTLNSYDDIANGASFIDLNCAETGGDIVPIWTTAGQNFFTDKWNVIVTGDWC